MSRLHVSKRIDVGDRIADRLLITISSMPVRIPDEQQIVHLQFRRFAGCPVCNLHLRSVAQRHAEIAAAGVREVVVFHSPAHDLLAHAADLPFAVVADPHKQLYADFGVESAPQALLDPRAWLPIVRGVVHSLWAILRKQQPIPSVNPHGGRLGLPADFLIASDGRVIACKYGDHVYDQWSVDEILALAASRAPAPRANAFPILEDMPMQQQVNQGN